MKKERRLKHMASSKNMRGGKVLQPSYDGYSVTTQDIQDYLQEKINCVCAAGDYTEPIKIRLVSQILCQKGHERQFTPFLLFLSDSARAKQKTNNNGINPVFQTENQTDQLQLIKPIWQLIQSFAFTNRDLKWHTNPKTKKEFYMSKENVDNLWRFHTPSTARSSKGATFICVWLDPLKVIYDYLMVNAPSLNNLTSANQEMFSTLRGITSMLMDMEDPVDPDTFKDELSREDALNALKRISDYVNSTLSSTKKYRRRDAHKIRIRSVYMINNDNAVYTVERVLRNATSNMDELDDAARQIKKKIARFDNL